MAHNHGQQRTENRRALTIVLGLVSLYMVAEVVGGVLANSLALLADAGHMLSDAGALALSLFAFWVSARPSGARHTYGYYRAEILAALVNGVTLVVIAILIFIEAIDRLDAPPDVHGPLMMGIAVGGLAINLVGLKLLSAGRQHSLNMRGAWLHVLTDALGSIGAVLAGGLIWVSGWHWADPVMSILIGLLVIYSSWHLLSEAVAVLMESAPRNIDPDEVRSAMLSTDDVLAVYDLHIWTITSGMVAMSAHVATGGVRDRDGVSSEIRDALRTRFGIGHATIEIKSTESGRLDLSV